MGRYALDLATQPFRKILDRLSPLRPTLVFGVIEQSGPSFFNTAVAVSRGGLDGFYRKTYLESFNGRFRDECLNEHWFTSLAHAQAVIHAWRRGHNEERPQKGLG